MLDLKDRNIVVAGGAGLIGSAVCGLLSRYKARVTVIDNSDPGFCLADNLNLHGKLHGFVNTTYPTDFIDHFTTFIGVTEIVAKYMAAQPYGGSIVNLASVYGVVGPNYSIYPNNMDMPPEYSAVKGGIIAHSRTLAVKYAYDNVRINCVSPGGVWDGQDKDFIWGYCKRTPMFRMASPEDVAGPVAFLLSDMAGYITGQNLIVDGGLTAR